MKPAFRCIENPRQAEKVEREVSRLESLVKGGTATAEDRRRYGVGLDHLCVWWWTQERPPPKRGQRSRKEESIPPPSRMSLALEAAIVAAVEQQEERMAAEAEKQVEFYERVEKMLESTAKSWKPFPYGRCPECRTPYVVEDGKIVHPGRCL